MSKLFVNTIAPNSGDTVTLSGSLLTTGKLIIGDQSTDTVAFISEISSSLIPDVGATYALGTMANSWGSAHIHGLAHIHTASINLVSSSLIPDHKNYFTTSHNLGSSAQEWKGLFVRSISCSQQISCSNIGVKHNVVSNLKPQTDGTLSLGTLINVDGASSTKRWKNIYAVSLQATTITASGNISASGTVSADAFSITKATAASQDLANLGPGGHTADYSVNGSKVEVRAITHNQINDGAFASFKLLNTSIASDSVVLGSFTGGTAGVITGSILTAATTAARTASIQIHNETGGAIAADTPFTASFVVL